MSQGMVWTKGVVVWVAVGEKLPTTSRFRLFLGVAQEMYSQRGRRIFDARLLTGPQQPVTLQQNGT
ncbi:hypothetical protein Strvi_3741 [Streptomyces violaceusniger Tu 4113]|uniref:Uncharacterized protein n=2 Tax=Streptomyces violaceusniger TaxID=68280 RepID=G2NZD6_STRV4|nr:hypothetical protein Strvi_3741 [Streptomyces violaceusniger Tu 4113]